MRHNDPAKIFARHISRDTKTHSKLSAYLLNTFCTILRMSDIRHNRAKAPGARGPRLHPLFAHLTQHATAPFPPTPSLSHLVVTYPVGGFGNVHIYALDSHGLAIVKMPLGAPQVTVGAPLVPLLA